MTRVFIDGSSGTTGLRIYDRLRQRKDIELTQLDEKLRKNASARSEALNSADVVFLCLPDDAAKEAVSLVQNPNTVVIDCSTAHRTADGWVYGFAELPGQREKIMASKRIANPGCHATGFISLVAPLVSANIIPHYAKLSCFSLTGFSGGGKKMIAEYGKTPLSELYKAPRLYGLSQMHKHLPEMKTVCGLDNEPAFMPVVDNFYSGMQVVVPLFCSQINGDAKAIAERYRSVYNNGAVHFCEQPDEHGFMSAAAFSGRDDLEVSVLGNKERILLVSRFDNLGKGASGAAIQNMNIVLGMEESTGLVIREDIK